MDYARGNREELGNQSFFLMPWRDGGEGHPVTGRMREIAPLRFYRSAEEREGILREEKTDFFYCIKNGFNDGVFSRKVPTGIHAIFRESEFHGDVYAYVSPWLSDVMAYGQAPWVPHMVRFFEETGDLRVEGVSQRPEGGGRWSEVVIPKEATVFGRHGGDDSFDIPWVQETVIAIARKNPDFWFLFLNTRQFPGAQNLPNIQFLPPTADAVTKRKFLNSCDAMLHGRIRGETFGLSCLEFAMLGKPVLTYANSPERAHLEILGDAAVAYQNAEELKGLLGDVSWVKKWKGERVEELRGLRVEEGTSQQRATINQQPAPSTKASDSRFKQYEPEAVMKKFEQVFLK